MDDLQQLQLKLSNLKLQLASILPPEESRNLTQTTTTAQSIHTDPHLSQISPNSETVPLDLNKLDVEDLLAEVTYVRLVIDTLKWADGCTPLVLANPKQHIKCVFVSFTFPWTKQSAHFGQVVTGLPKQILHKIILWNYRWVQPMQLTVQLMDLWKQSDLQIKVFHRAHLTNSPEILGTATIPMKDLLQIPFAVEGEIPLMSPVGNNRKKGDIKISLRLGSRFDWFNEIVSQLKMPGVRESLRFRSGRLDRTFTTSTVDQTSAPPTSVTSHMPELFNLKNFSAIQHPDSQPLQRLSDRQDDHTDSEEHGVSPVGFHTEALKSPSVSPVNEKEIEEYLSFRQKPKQVESRECQTDLSLLIDGTYEINLVNIGAHNSSIQTGSEVKTENQQRNESQSGSIHRDPILTDRSNTSIFSVVSTISSPPQTDKDSRPTSGKFRKQTVASRLFSSSSTDNHKPSVIISVLSYYSNRLDHSANYSVAFVDSEGTSHCSSLAMPDDRGNLVVWNWRKSAVVTYDRSILPLKIFSSHGEDTKLVAVANVPLHSEIGGEVLSLSPELSVEVLDMQEMKFNGIVNVQFQFITSTNTLLSATVEEVMREQLCPSL